MPCLYIICEGTSEAIFVQKRLAEYLYAKGCKYSIFAPILKSPKAKNQANKGGNVGFNRLKSYIEKFLLQESDCLISTFVDFYAIGNDFPNYTKLANYNNVYEQVNILETDLQVIANRVIPYLQLYEYETLYFAALDSFVDTDPTLNKIKNKLERINQAFDNKPELVNNGKTTAPSKRIEDLMATELNLKYKKTWYAERFTVECNNKSIDLIRGRCPHFDAWITKLICLTSIS